MLSSSQTFGEQIRRAWGNPAVVATAAFNELFRHVEEIGLDHDDQVRYAMEIGVLAGLMKDSTPDEFIIAFEKTVLNK